MNRLFLFLIITFAIPFYTFSQNSVPKNNFQSYSLEDGLSQNVVRTIKQDSLGYLWIGTEDGLNKFNGYEFKVFKSEEEDSNSISDNFIYSLAADSNGIMWVGTNSGGLARYNPGKEDFTVYKHDPEDPTSINEGRIYTIHVGSEGKIWTGNYGGGLNLFMPEENKFRRYTNESENQGSISSNNIFDIAEDDEGNLWIRTEKDINKFDQSEKTFESFNVPGDRLVFEQPNSMFMDQDEVLWIPYLGGIMKFNTNTEKSSLLTLSEFENTTITSIRKHNDDQLWIGSYDGLFLFDKTNNSIVAEYTSNSSDPNSIHDDIIVTLYKDKTGSLWIAYGNTGISKLNTQQKNIKHYKHKPGQPHSIPGNIVRGLMVDSKENIWVGTRNENTFVINRETDEVKVFEPQPGDPSGMYSKKSTCFYEDDQGNIYMGSWGAGMRVLRNRETNDFGRIPPVSAGKENSLRDSIIQAIYQDDDDVFWIGHEQGLDLYNPKTEQTRYIKHDPDNNNSITPMGVQAKCIEEDMNGNFWIGTWGGLTMMKPKSSDASTFDTEYDYFRFIDSLSDERVISLQYSEERPEAIFVGTYGGGLNKININFENPSESKITTYTEADGLCNNVIFGILADEMGNLWLSTNKGLSRFNIEEETFTNFDANSGLQSSQFRWGAHAKGKGNELLFGGHNGFNVFDASDIKIDSTLPQIVITDFQISNESIQAGEKVNNKVILKKNINNTNKLNLSYKENMLSFEFAALHYAFPEDNQYKYKLKGFDENWIEVSSDKRFATYTNLNPGKYTFKVKASNYDGVWNEEGKTLKIEIKPPFWQTIWFYISIAAIGIGIILLIIKWRERATRREKEKLQQKVDEAVSEVEKQKQAMEEKNRELLEKQEEIQRNNWISGGLAKFGDILRKEKDNMAEFSYHLISNLVKYVGAHVGAIYLVNDEDENNQFIEMMGCYAYEKRKDIDKKIYFGEGLIGRSIKDHETIYLTKLPENYITIKSGLGESNPNALLIIPLVTGDEVYGAIEIASFGEFSKIQRDFLDKLAEDIAVTIKTTKINLRTSKLLQQSKEQYEELSSQKEEMQQNMEELKATQEESDKRKAEMENLLNALKRSHYFIQYDTEGNIIDINDKYLKLYGKKQDEIVGTHYSNLKQQTKENRKDHKTLWKALLDGKSQEETIEIKKNKKTYTLSCVYTPILDQRGKTEKVLQIAADITKHLS